MVNRNANKMETWNGLGSLIQCKLWLGPKLLSLNKRIDLNIVNSIGKAKQSKLVFDYEFGLQTWMHMDLNILIQIR